MDNINNLRYADDITHMVESKEELKSLLMKGKEESEKAGLKCNIQKSNIMASGPIASWQIDGETMEIVGDFIFGGSRITADGDCSHEIKRRLLLGREVMTNLDSILKISYTMTSLFNAYAEYIMRNAGLEEAQTGIKTAGRNINNLRYTDDTTLIAESEEELKSLLMKV